MTRDVRPMINDRPELLLAANNYKGIPNVGFDVDMEPIPDLVRISMRALGGIQPVTRAGASAAGGELRDRPSQGEIALHHRLGSRFQLVFVVMNIATLRGEGSELQGTPYSISLIPASKRGVVEAVSIDYVAQLDPETLMRGQPCYMGYDPFQGDWRLFSNLDLFRGNQSTFIDELGLVIDHYYLAMAYDEKDVLRLGVDIGSPEAQAKLNKHRNKRFFRPFKRVAARRVWGAESPIELFLLQGLLHRGLSPSLQMILCDDGSSYGALYHLWRDRHLDALPGQITEADLYFPEQRLAVFCDSQRHHSRGKDIAKDKRIDGRLAAAGFTPLRLSGADIVRNLGPAVDCVIEAIANAK